VSQRLEIEAEAIFHPASSRLHKKALSLSSGVELGTRRKNSIWPNASQSSGESPFSVRDCGGGDTTIRCWGPEIAKNNFSLSCHCQMQFPL
jgi:hypothetical protein